MDHPDHDESYKSTASSALHVKSSSNRSLERPSSPRKRPPSRSRTPPSASYTHTDMDMDVDVDVDQPVGGPSRDLRQDPQQDPPQQLNVSMEEEDDDLSQPEDATFIWKARMFCGKLVNNEHVQIGIIVAIIVNALMMGLATFPFVEENPKVEKAFADIDTAFLVVFTIEVAMQLAYLGVALFADGWLFFDFMIVVLSWSFESLQIVRAFRIFRAFRLITRVKPLRDLVLAIGAVMPPLLLLIFYIFSVLFTELYSSLDLSEEYFTTLDRSLYTCMEMMTLEWGDIAREVIAEEPLAWAPFSAFILITGFIVFNLIVAVVCDAVAITEKTVRELDGFESDSPENKLAEAQERIDLLQCHINDMLRTQENVQNMIELIAGDLLHIEAERMKAENREAELRIEMERRIAYEREMQTKRQLETLGRSYTLEKERQAMEKRDRERRRKAQETEQQQAQQLSQSLHARLLPERGVPERRRSRQNPGSGMGMFRSGSRLSLVGGSLGSRGALTPNDDDKDSSSLRSFESE
eukprot:Nitzschia sp. Nitz4//scaffold89_size161592//143487//145076//NITZ4_002400-RA/size161592-processed-gene-0.24-mRNA-1//1//CDS//3329559682//4307//frame0